MTTDGTNLYWVLSNLLAGKPSLLKMPVAGGTPVTLASGIDAETIAVDATNVYWGNSGTDKAPVGAVVKVPIAGGTPVTVTTSARCTALTLRQHERLLRDVLGPEGPRRDRELRQAKLAKRIRSFVAESAASGREISPRSFALMRSLFFTSAYACATTSRAASTRRSSALAVRSATSSPPGSGVSTSCLRAFADALGG